MKRKMKRYAEGGDMMSGDYQPEEVGTPNISAPEDKVSEDDLSFKDIFAMKRKAGAKDFTWRGKKYTTEMAGTNKPPAKEEVTDEVTISTPRLPKRTANLAPRGSNSPTAKPYTPTAFEGGRQLRDFLERDRKEKAERNKGAAERFGEFVRNTRMVGGAPSWTKNRPDMKKGGAVKKYSSGGSTSSASKRADGIGQRGKTRGKMC